MADRCYRCQFQFGFLQRHHNCVICGALVCEKCSSCDLIVYVPDDEDEMESVSPAALAKLAIIKIVGVRPCCSIFSCFTSCTVFIIVDFCVVVLFRK